MTALLRKELVQSVLHTFNASNIDYDVYIIANTCDKTPFIGPAGMKHASEDEFFSRIEFAEIASAIFNVFGYVKVFYSEIDFCKYVFENNIKRNECVVYNLSRDGRCEGKKSLIPALCDLLDLRYTGSNAFVISLLRNKYAFGCLLQRHNIPLPTSWIYNSSEGFLDGQPLSGQEIIIKNLHESASIGLTEDNIITFDNTENTRLKMHNRCTQMNSKTVLVQEYISGYECEVLVLKIKGKYIALDPVEIVLGSQRIISSDVSNNYQYDFAPLYEKFPADLCSKIQAYSEHAAKILNVENYARFDFRITEDMQCFLIDIAGTPYTIQHSSVAYLFQDIYNLAYEDIYKVIVELAIQS